MDGGGSRGIKKADITEKDDPDIKIFGCIACERREDQRTEDRFNHVGNNQRTGNFLAVGIKRIGSILVSL